MHAKQRLASLHDARETFFRALKTHEHMIYKLGYEDGFNAGWEAAVQRLSQVKPEVTYEACASDDDLSDLLTREEYEAPLEETPTHETLLSIISKTPGLQRHEIVHLARKSLSTLNERTIRTALQRMKSVGELRVLDNRWYVTEKPKTMSPGAAGAGE